MKIVKKTIALTIIVVMAFLLFGCAENHELKNLDVLTAMGIDKQDEKFEIYAQVLKSAEATSDSLADSYRYFIGAGDDFVEAVDSVYAQGSGELTFSHNKLYLFSLSEVSNKEELKEILLNSTYDIRPQSYCVIVKNKMDYFVTAADDYGYDCNYKLLEILKNEENAPTVNDILLALNNGKKNIMIPVVEVNKGIVSIESWLTVNDLGIGTKF